MWCSVHLGIWSVYRELYLVATKVFLVRLAALSSQDLMHPLKKKSLV
jgi:hypothetical protein